MAQIKSDSYRFEFIKNIVLKNVFKCIRKYLDFDKSI